MNGVFNLNIQPSVRVGIVENGGFGLHLQGEYNISGDENSITYIPQNEDCRVIVDNVEIGKHFHWHRKQQQSFEGIMQIRNIANDHSCLINILPIEKYLKSVISSEMNPNSHLEFLKAHAVISRSWVMRMISKTNNNLADDRCYNGSRIIDWTDSAMHQAFDVCADDHCQRYQGDSIVNKNAEIAVSQTVGEVLVDMNGEICDARFSKCCGGKTERFSSLWQPIDYHYLQSVLDPYCNPNDLTEYEYTQLRKSILNSYDSETTDFYQWQHKISGKKIRDNILKYYNIDLGEIKALTPLKRGVSGRIIELQIEGSLKSIIVGKELTIRKLLSDTHLYSSCFSIERRDDEFVLFGKGWGHGVGLCQIGAAIMAQRGFSYRDILCYYYQNSKIIKIYER